MDRNTQVQAVLDRAVDSGISPAFAACYTTTASTSPVYTAGVSDLESRKPLQADALWSLISASKLVASLAVLRALDRGLVGNMSLESGLDDATALQHWLPEFRVNDEEPHMFMQIFEGWQDKDRRQMRLRPATKGVTLRHLLTFTAGSRGDYDDKEAFAMVTPSKGTPPPCQPSWSNTVASLAQPRFAEAGDEDAFGYGGAAQDWIGIFLTRALGKTQRQIIRELILDPLEIPRGDYDYLMTEEMLDRRLPIFAKSGQDWKQSKAQAAFDNWEFGPPEGYHERSQIAFSATIPGFVAILRAIVTRSTKLLSEKAWQLALADDLPHRHAQVVLPNPLLRGEAIPNLNIHPLHLADPPYGLSLLQAIVTRRDSELDGCSKGTIWWGGVYNFWWWIDINRGIAGVFATQRFPFSEPALMEVFTQVKRAINLQVDSQSHSPPRL